ncbi:MAG: inositol monophosphatase [Sedimentisphaerales bacterium]|nr:inositol monophosphatase [Sedimentisphaerales bacterium]
MVSIHAKAECTRELEIALDAAGAAGRYLRDSRDDVRIETFKDGVHNYATVQDVEAERIIVDTIRRHFGDDAILSEESFPDAASADRLWIVDPLDGTRNYANGLPYFSVSIAFCRDNVPQAGVVYAPCLNDERFHAVRGRGACLNGAPLLMANPDAKLAASIVGTGFAYRRGETLKKELAQYERTLNQATDVVRYGSAALDMCYVAAGRLAAYYEAGLKPWDVAAASLIVEEAGGICSDHASNKLDILRKADGQFAVNLLCSKNLDVAHAMLHILQA